MHIVNWISHAMYFSSNYRFTWEDWIQSVSTVEPGSAIQMPTHRQQG